jgi:tetratricopeptide (TPR) repeat protein
MSRKAAISTTSNCLLSLAKIYQDAMTSSAPTANSKTTTGVRDILALYYLSLSLQPSPSTANNVGILLASIQQAGVTCAPQTAGESQLPDIPGVVPGSGIALALAYYNYGLNLDSRHAHLYTNLGSLLKDIGQLPAAIKMYEQAVQCDSNFDIALANLANAVKDSGRINDAIGYYKRAVNANPDFAEAVCGLANALNSVCNWVGRGGVARTRGIRDPWHVDDRGMLRDANEMGVPSGWMKRVVDIVDKQLKDGELWGCGTLSDTTIEQVCRLLTGNDRDAALVNKRSAISAILRSWSGQKWEGSRVVRLIERAIRFISWQWYQDRYVHRKEYRASRYARPQLPSGLTPPNAPTVLPFHTFTCPLSAKQIRHISQRNGMRISSSTLRAPWLPQTVYRPPPPPNPCLNVGYVSSDFNNHPLAHLMQSVFGLHDPRRVKAFCYATTASDNSIHRQQIEREAPVFRDTSGWSVDRLVEQIVSDGIHILVNLNGYTRGARNEVFAARPAPIHMSFMGFAGTLGAEWCDYILADELSIPPDTLSPRRRHLRLDDRLLEEDHAEEADDWVYGEKIVYTRHTFFCCDHRQSAPDSHARRVTWEEEQANRWRMRKEMFPDLSDDTIILGNFNQLYKVCTSFSLLLRIPRSGRAAQAYQIHTRLSLRLSAHGCAS